MPHNLAVRCSTRAARALAPAQHRQQVPGSSSGCCPMARRAPASNWCSKATSQGQHAQAGTRMAEKDVNLLARTQPAHALSTVHVEPVPSAMLDHHILVMMVALLCTTVSALLEPSGAGAAEAATSVSMSAGLPASMLVLAAASTSQSNVDLLGILLHNPILAAIVAVGALVLIPRLIQFSINVLAVPAMVIFVVYLAASHPDTTQAAVTSVFRWIFDHPVITSGAILVVATVLLLPSLIVGAGALGAVALLSQVVAPDFAPPEVPNTTQIATQQTAGQPGDGITAAGAAPALSTAGQDTSLEGAVIQATDGTTVTTDSGKAARNNSPAQPKGPLDGVVSKYKTLSALKLVPALPKELSQLPSELPKVTPRSAPPAGSSTAPPSAAGASKVAESAVTTTAAAATAAAVVNSPATVAPAISTEIGAGPEVSNTVSQLQPTDLPASTASPVSEQPAAKFEQPAAVSEGVAEPQQSAEGAALNSVLGGATLLTLPASNVDLPSSPAPAMLEVAPAVDSAAGGNDTIDRLMEILERS